MQGPITGIGPFNTFTLCSRRQLLTLERDHSSINASARQKLTAAIKADKASPSVQALRLLRLSGFRLSLRSQILSLSISV